MPGGVSHNNRKALPFPLYIDRASGPYKWDVDGNRYVDYHMGSAALLAGHSHLEVLEEISASLQKGTGATACHELEIEWASLICDLVPCAEKVRFVASGAEATMLGMRIARAFTRKSQIVRLEGHYHGWHDYGMLGFNIPLDVPSSAGVPQVVADTVLVAEADDFMGNLERLVSGEDVAAVILEASGARWGAVPLPSDLLQRVRQLTKEFGVLLIFDEVITGFRYAPGGAQERFDVVPDMASMGKIMTGGLPGGAIVGRTEVMETLSPWRAKDNYVFHYGTFNGNPISAAAGLANLKLIKDGVAQKQADRHAELLRGALQEEIQSLSIAGFSYGESSVFHVYFSDPEPSSGAFLEPERISRRAFLQIPQETIDVLHRELRFRGVDPLSYNGGVTSSAHGDDELEIAVDAFKGAFKTLRELGLVAAS